MNIMLKKDRPDTESLVLLGSHMWKQEEKQLIWKYNSDCQTLERAQGVDGGRIKVAEYDQCVQYALYENTAWNPINIYI